MNISFESITVDLDTLIQKINKNDIIMDSEIDTRDNWNNTYKSRFIEHILLGLPIQSLYFIQNNIDRKTIIIFGKRELQTIQEFIGNGARKLRLNNLEYITELNGKLFCELPQDDIDYIKSRKIFIKIMKTNSRLDLRYLLFNRY